MTVLEQIRALYAYNEWANGHLLEASAGLSDEELGRTLGASFGSVQGNLSHMVWAQVVWLARWTGLEMPEVPPPGLGDVLGPIREAYQASHEGLRRYVSSLADGDLSGVVSYVDTKGDAQERPLWQVMLHMVSHGTHHRAETALLLTSLGKAPRQLDYIFFELERA